RDLAEEPVIEQEVKLGSQRRLHVRDRDDRGRAGVIQAEPDRAGDRGRVRVRSALGRHRDAQLRQGRVNCERHRLARRDNSTRSHGKRHQAHRSTHRHTPLIPPGGIDHPVRTRDKPLPTPPSRYQPYHESLSPPSWIRRLAPCGWIIQIDFGLGVCRDRPPQATPQGPRTAYERDPLSQGYAAAEGLMQTALQTQVARILQEVDQREDASAALLRLVYEQLKAIAAARMRAERSGHTLQATALV